MNIESLRRKAEYYEHDAPPWARVIWTRPASFNHFIKFNRDALVEAMYEGRESDPFLILPRRG